MRSNTGALTRAVSVKQRHAIGLRRLLHGSRSPQTEYSPPRTRILMPHALVARDASARLTRARGLSLPTPLGAEGQRWARLYGLEAQDDPWRASALAWRTGGVGLQTGRSPVRVRRSACPRSGSQRAAERQRPLSSRDRPFFAAVATAGMCQSRTSSLKAT